MPLVVREISPAEHAQFVREHPRLSFLQTPSWAGVKAEWGSQNLGWFDGDQLVGAGLVLTRQVPKLPQFLAYLPEGPAIDWSGEAFPQYQLDDWLAPMLEHFRQAGAFLVKMGPQVGIRQWGAGTLKAAIAAESATRLREVPPDESWDAGTALIERLQQAGWTQQPDTGAGCGDVQPRYVFQVPLAGRTSEDVFTGFNQLWRRNIRKADKLGVEVRQGTRDDLSVFHPLYVETAARDGFVPRGQFYFERMWDAMTDEDPERIALYIASYQDTPLAATTMVTVGKHSWYSYGASADAQREVRPSNAIQWRMITDSLERGCDVYDMRGISDTLDPNDPLFGLIRFKLGTGGHALEYVGEWDFALRPTTAKAFDMYMRRASIKANAKDRAKRWFGKSTQVIAADTGASK